MFRRRVIAAAALAAMTLPFAIAPSAHAAQVVNHQELAKQVASAVAPTFPDLPVGTATCPKRIVRKAGTVAICEVSVGGMSLEFKVTQTDKAGNASVESTQAVIPKAKAEQFVQNNSTIAPRVDCGGGDYIVRRPGGPFWCTAVFPDGLTQQVLIAVNDTAGAVTIAQVL